MYYSPTTLKMAGFKLHDSAIWFADIIAFSNAYFTFLVLPCSSQHGTHDTHAHYLLCLLQGWRTLLLVSLSGVVAALVMPGITFYGDMVHTGYMAVATSVVYVASRRSMVARVDFAG